MPSIRELIEHSCSVPAVKFLIQCLTQLEEMIDDINVELQNN